MFLYYCLNRIGCVIYSVLASSVVDCGFEPRSGHTKDYTIGMEYDTQYIIFII
jgi:hypothetical protein